jgi:hypothetical protein
MAWLTSAEGGNAPRRHERESDRRTPMLHTISIVLHAIAFAVAVAARYIG